SPSHQLAMQQVQQADGSPVTQIQLAQEDRIPNKDLILRYQVAGQETQSTVLTHGDNRGGHFAAYLIPAIAYQSHEIVPKDVVFLIDTSGSQAGEPLEQSKALMRRFINGLNPGDTFTIIDFANSARALSPQPLANTPGNRSQALNYINHLQANGGTEMLNGVNTVLNFPPAENGRLRSIVLLTDGLIGDEDRIIAQIQQKLQPGNRLYSFGVGSSVNRFLLNRVAEVGRGISHVVRHDEAIEQVTENFLQRLNKPILTNIEVTWEGLGKPPEIYPLKAADLFAEQPLVLMGRKQDRLSGNLRIRGIAAGGKPYEKTFSLSFDETGGNPAIAQLWGRSKIKALMLQMARGETSEGIAAVTNIALAYRLMSKYTAFVAVSDESRVDASATGKTARVPVETPEGMQDSGDFASTRIPEPNFVWALLVFGLFLTLVRVKPRAVKPSLDGEIVASAGGNKQSSHTER
ncbi:MAG: VWA domain-containing protein, partial [Cyanobacteriota bacterium]|nr:VWA domain-containing protein [Cyanobacteriota bacterium]